MQAFEGIWKRLLRRLERGQYIRNWTAKNGYFGESFRVKGFTSKQITFDVPSAENLQTAPVDDFKAVWEVWEDYKSGKVLRKDITPLTWYSRYIISTFRWYDEIMKRD